MFLRHLSVRNDEDFYESEAYGRASDAPPSAGSSYRPCVRFPQLIEARVRRVFMQWESVLAGGGLSGDILLQQLESGHLYITFISGPMQACLAVYLPGYDDFLIGRSRWEVYQLPLKNASKL
jgi:hypothetical protein